MVVWFQMLKKVGGFYHESILIVVLSYSLFGTICVYDRSGLLFSDIIDSSFFNFTDIYIVIKQVANLNNVLYQGTHSVATLYMIV